MSPRKIHDRKLPVTSKKVKEPQKPSVEDMVHFSFKHLDLQHKKFSIDTRRAQYFQKLLSRLKDLSGLTRIEFQTNRSSALRAHPITWERTSEKEGFMNLNDQLKEIPPYQFEVSVNEHGRVHGFFVDNIFFIVWFDPDHLLYSG